jgi:hypothetical protein
MDGYMSVSVVLDGTAAPAVGVIVMNGPHSLSAGASLRPSGNRVDSTIASASRAMVVSVDAAASMSLLLRRLDSSLKSRPDDAEGSVKRVRALTYDARVGLDALQALSGRLAGKSFVVPEVGPTPAIQAARTPNLQSSGVPITIVFVNGILVNAAGFAADYSLFLDRLLGPTDDIPHDPATSISPHGYFVASQGLGGTLNARLNCFAEALRFSQETSPDWVTEAQTYTRCGDLSAASQDIASILTGGDASPDAIKLAALVRSEMSRGQAVILVGHSRGTLVSEQALQLVKSNPAPAFEPLRCLGFVSIASPLWSQEGWGESLSWGVIAKGQHVKDLMLSIVPGTTKAPSVETDVTKLLDARYPTDQKMQGWYSFLAGLELHQLSAYLAGSPVSSMIRQAIKGEAAVMQTSCAPTIALSKTTLAFVSQSGVPTLSQQIAIANSGTRTLAGLSAGVAYKTGAADWLSLTLSSSSTPAMLTVTPVTNGIAPGTYEASISIASNAAGIANSPQPLSVVLTVVPPSSALASVRLTPSSVTLSVAATQQLTASGVDAQGNSIGLGTIAWTTSNANVASVNAAGLVTGVGVGSTTIMGTSGGRSGTSSIDVQAPPTAAAPIIQLSQPSVGFTAISGGSNPSAATVSITNGGTGTLAGLSLFSINYAQLNATDPTGWLSQSLTSSTAPSTLSLSATTAGIPVGNYSAVVSVGSSAPGLVGGPKNLNVTFTVTAGAPTPGVMQLNPTDYVMGFVATPPAMFSFPAELCNTGDLSFTWTVASSTSLVTVSPASGRVDRTCQTVTVTGDARSIGSGVSLLGVVTFTPNAGTRIFGQNWINVKASKP